MRLACLALLLFLSGCVVDSKGILLEVEPATPLDQRDLHKHCDLGDAAACALTHTDAASRPPAIIPIVQGIAPQDRAVFAALVPKTSLYSWFLYDRELGQLWKLHTARIQTRPGSTWAVQRVEVRGLEPDHEYELLASDQSGKLLEDRSFRTLSANADSLRIALVSGLKNRGQHDIDQLMAGIATKDPSLVLLSGGNMDLPLPKKFPESKPAAAMDYFFDRYARMRSGSAFAREPNLIPIGATWDDSEFGQANGNRTFSYRDQAREALEIYFPRWADEERVVNGPGTALSFELGESRIALLDNRTFRAPTPLAPAPECRKKGKKKVCAAQPAPLPAPGARFGHLQIDWLKRQYEKNEMETYLFSGEPWFGSFSPDWADRATRPSGRLTAISSGGFAILDDSSGALEVQETFPLVR